MHAKLDSLLLADFSVERITAEVVVRPGLPQLRITGMSAGPARETAERLRAVMHSLGVRLPATSVLLHLAPGDLSKRGAYLDLPLLATFLMALGVPAPGTLLFESWDSRTLFLGETSLDGTLRFGRPLLPLLVSARSHGFLRAVLPRAHEHEASMCCDLECIGIDGVADLLRLGGRRIPLRPPIRALRPRWGGPIPSNKRLLRGVLASAAGAHALLMVGPPGTGKTTLAALLHTLLPALRDDELLEITALRAMLSKQCSLELAATRPMRAPHHSVTLAGLVGGGRPPSPGEVTLAHGGLLFLDEMGEVQRETLQSLREPLESGQVNLARGAAMLSSLPARFWFAGASNPCPCGFANGHAARCTCSAPAIRSYLSRIRGPLEDRIDVQLRLGHTYGAGDGAAPEFEALVASVERAEERQRRRFAGSGIRRNGEIDGGLLDRFAPLVGEAHALWPRLVRELNGRGRAGVRRLARTLADLSGVAEIRTVDLQEAVYLRDPLKSTEGGD